MIKSDMHVKQLCHICKQPRDVPEMGGRIICGDCLGDGRFNLWLAGYNWVKLETNKNLLKILWFLVQIAGIFYISNYLSDLFVNWVLLW